jgi:hypothetical protein
MTDGEIFGTATTEKQIDEIVYALTPEEIAIVERKA